MKFGIRVMYMIFIILLLFGQFVFAMGCSYKQILIMVGGN